MGSRWYILGGEDGRTPILADDMLHGAVWMGGFTEKRRVALTTVGPYEVSTVFLGLDHSFGDGPPILFETMAFGPEDSQSDTLRYATWAEAEEGHALIVSGLQKRLGLLIEDGSAET